MAKQQTPQRNEKLTIDQGTKRPSLIRELGEFLLENKKWWLLPILLALIGFGALVMLSSSGLAPFLYTLF